MNNFMTDEDAPIELAKPIPSPAMAYNIRDFMLSHPHCWSREGENLGTMADWQKALTLNGQQAMETAYYVISKRKSGQADRRVYLNEMQIEMLAKHDPWDLISAKDKLGYLLAYFKVAESIYRRASESGCGHKVGDVVDWVLSDPEKVRKLKEKGIL